MVEHHDHGLSFYAFNDKGSYSRKPFNRMTGKPDARDFKNPFNQSVTQRANPFGILLHVLHGVVQRGRESNYSGDVFRA